jgi:NAD(P)-dependent dehydrogenase (short-subunit alcohol dehydrogenase family)
MKLPDTIIITGANGQTAVQLAGELLKHNCKLLLIAHNRTERIDLLKKDYPDICYIRKCDLNSFEQTSEVLYRFISETGLNPTGLVHAAAIRSYDAKSLAESEPAVWNSIFSQNIDMAYNVMRCILPVMLKQKQGKIVLFGSNVTRTGLPYGSAYAAAKTALANLVRSTAWENAPENIQINMVSPAPIETKLEDDYSGAYLKFRQEYFEAYKNSHPAHKLVSPEDITRTILPLLDLETTSVSGEEIFVTGGVL